MSVQEEFVYLDDSTATTAQTATDDPALPEGFYEFALYADGSEDLTGVTITIEKRICRADNTYGTVALVDTIDGGDKRHKLIYSNGDKFTVTRAGGSAGVTLVARPVKSYVVAANALART